MKLTPVYLFYAAVSAVPMPQLGKGNGTCNAAMTAMLTGGIQANLDIQAQELKGLKTLQMLASANTTRAAINGTSDFEIERQALLAIQKKGIDIRTQNQRVAGDINSPSQRGLAIVAQTQNMEMIQVKGLRGGGANATKLLQTLIKEVEDGTKQNQMNLQMAESQCKKG